MKTRKRVERSDNLFAEFNATIKKMSEDWEQGVKELFPPLALPSFPEIKFPDLLIPDMKPEVRK